MVEEFSYAKDGDVAERRYIAWTKDHPRSFIINQIGRKIRLHINNGCNHFYDETTGRCLTGNKKICSDDRQLLESWAEEYGPTPLQFCRSCKLG